MNRLKTFPSVAVCCAFAAVIVLTPAASSRMYFQAGEQSDWTIDAVYAEGASEDDQDDFGACRFGHIVAEGEQGAQSYTSSHVYCVVPNENGPQLYVHSIPAVVLHDKWTGNTRSGRVVRGYKAGEFPEGAGRWRIFTGDTESGQMFQRERSFSIDNCKAPGKPPAEPPIEPEPQPL